VNEGTAIIRSIIQGMIVQTASKLVLCIILDGNLLPSKWISFSEVNANTITTSIHVTKKLIKIKKKKMSWCRSIIPSMISVAGGKKSICQGTGWNSAACPLGISS
jgi:hypothetical protein